MAILALVLPIVLGACGGSDSKSDSGSAELKAADLVDIDNPNTSSQSTTTTTQNSAVMLSSANITSLKQECKQKPGCLAVYEYFVNYINQTMDKAFISSKACFAFFRDMINVIAPGEWDPWLDWELLNLDRCVVKAD